MTRRALGAAALVIALSAASSVIDAQEWSRFRGSDAGVAADDPALPDTWSQTENVVWTRAIPGIGWSSPVVWGDHIFVSTVVNTTQQEPPKPGLYLGDWPASPAPHRWMVYDIDFRTGAVRWEREVSSAPPGKAKHLKNSYASETAVTDGERVYFYFANAGLFAFDFSGKPVWSKPLGPFKTRNNWGTAASPVLHRERQANRRGGLESRSQGGHELDVAVRVGERTAHGDRDVGIRSRAVVRSLRQAVVGILRDVDDQHPHAVLAFRFALHQLRLYCGPAAASVRDSSRCVRRYLAETR
jgi:outer membrane protein assembly factor BamB